MVLVRVATQKFGQGEQAWGMVRVGGANLVARSGQKGQLWRLIRVGLETLGCDQGSRATSGCGHG